MSFKNKNYILMDQKVHYKMHKSKKQWLVIGISTFGLCLGIGIPTNLVKAESQTLKSPTTVNEHKQKNIAINDLVGVNAAKSPFTGISENYSTEEAFSQKFNNRQLSTVPVKTGYINAGTDQTGKLQLMYFNGISNGTDLKKQVGGSAWGEIKSSIAKPLFFAPNFSIKMGNGTVWSWVFSGGGLTTSAPFFAGINNDWNTADPGQNWKFWEISQSSDPLNSIITLKFTGDFTFQTSKTYTLDFTITLKPNGNMVDYNLAIRNVTALVNPSISAEDAKLPNFWFGSQYDTMLGNNDSVPMYYSGNNQGLYLENGGYKLLFNYTSKNAPTGWGAGRWSSTYKSVGINSPQDAGQKSSNAPAGQVAYSGGDSGLYMVWKGQDLANGDSREGNYQASISSSTAILPKLTINNQNPDNYIGKDYTVNGTVTYPVNDNNALPLKYYYIVDSQDPVEFNGPNINGTSPQNYSFTIPKEKMVPGDEHSISVYAVDAYGSVSNTQFLKLTANAELNTVDKTYYTGDQFMPFANFAGGVSVTGEALNSSDITQTEIKDATGQVIPQINWDSITTSPGTYTITYTYKYGSGKEGTKGGEVSQSATIKVIDRKYINLNYVDQNGNPIDNQLLTQLPAEMSPGQHRGAHGTNFALTKTDELKLNDKVYYTFIKFEDSNSQPINADHLVFGDNDQNINVIYQGAAVNSNDTNAITVHHYLRDKDNNDTTTPVKEDSHIGGNIGDTITINPADAAHQAPAGYTLVPNQESVQWMLKPNEGKDVTFYYTANTQNNITVKFVNAKNGNEVKSDNPEGKTGEELDLQANGTYIQGTMPEGYHYAKGEELNGKTQPTNPTYKDADPQEVTVYVAGDPVNSENNASSQITVHHYLDGTTTPVPGMNDTKIGGLIGDEVTVDPTAEAHQAPTGYTLAPDQTAVKWTLKPNEGKVVTFFYTADAQNNITVKFVNAKNGNEVKSDNPEGKTDDELNLQANGTYIQGAMPEGYHYATSEELNGKTQPDNVKYTSTAQTVTVYVAGNKVDSENNATSQITVHHYLEGTTTPVPGMNDTKIGGLIGDEVTVDPTAEAHQAPTGYTQVANQTAVKWMLKPNEGKDVTFYYTADPQNNITVNFVNAKNNQTLEETYVPEGHHTGDDLDLSDPDSTDSQSELKNHLPKGYHYAKGDELNGKTQSGNVKYTSTAQTVTVYVAGDPVDSENNATSQITVHHYLEGTTTTVPGMNDTKIGGLIGDEITVDPKDHQAPAGYTQVANQKAVKWMLKPNEGKDVTFYYTADPQNNITVNFVNAKNNQTLEETYVPEGHHTGDELDLSDPDRTDSQSELKNHLPKGYHYAKGDELNGKTQPGNVKYTSSAQTVTVYVAGDPVDSKNNALSQITVHHYLKDTTTTVPGMSDTKIGGFIGDEITVDPKDHQAPAGYSLEANQAAVKWTLKPNEGKEIIIYYTASEQANITVKYVDVATGEVVFEDKPQGHTGGILDLSENGAGLAKLPEGYHYAKSSELQSGQSQPTNPVYTTENQTKIVYVAGNIVANNAENAVTVHHYLENTTTTVPGMKDIHRGGRVGQTLTFQTTDPEQQAPQGYTLVTQEAQSWKLKAKEAGNLIFYYKAKDLSNVAIKFVNSQNGKEVKTDYPIRATGTTLNITDPNGEYLKTAIPAGYHYATSNELKTGQQQPNKDLTYTPQPQEATIYVTGEKITNAVTVHHYLQGTTTTVPGMKDIQKSGRVGDTLTFNPTDPEQEAPQGYTLVTKEAQTLTISADEGTKDLAFYYTANELNNITVNFINTKNNKTIYKDVPEGNHIGDELDLTSDSDYLKGILGENGKLKNYNYDHAEANKLTYKPESQTAKVYVTPKDGFDPVEVTIKFVNINNFSDSTTAELKGHAGDTISMDGNKIKVDSSDGNTVTPSSGYTLVTNDNLLNQRGLKQPKDEIIPIESKSEPLVFYVEKSLSTITIQHKYRIGSSLLSVPRMTNIVQTYRDGEAITINTNLPVHRAPSGYRLSWNQKYPLNNGLITIPVSEIPLNGIVTIYYDRIR